MDLTFNINQQVLKRTDTDKPANHSNKYLACSFEFSDDWTDFSKFAIFKTGEKNYRVAIVDDECIVPYNVLKHSRFILTVYGVNDDVRITTNHLWVHLALSGFVTEYDEQDYFNPDMTETLMELLNMKLDKVVHDAFVEFFADEITKISNNITALNTEKLSIIDFDAVVENINSNLELKVENTLFDETVNDLQSQINVLSSIKAIQVVTDKGDASEDTMNKLYIEVKSDTADVYYTVFDGSVYSWKKMDDDILDDVSIDWEDILNKPLYYPPAEHTHSYNSLKDKPFIPSKTSELTNDSGFVNDLSDYYSKEQVDDLINSVENKFILNGDKEIMQTGDILDLTVKIKEDGFVASNKDIFFYEVI